MTRATHYPYRAPAPHLRQPVSALENWAEPTDEPHRQFGAFLLLWLAAEVLLAGWVFWMKGPPWAWPVVIMNVFLAYSVLWLVVGMSVAGLACAALAAAAPARDNLSKTLAILAMLGHATVLAVVLYPLVFGRH
jgi:hypothetical protein